jgi:putative FmdB family regulatory protein
MPIYAYRCASCGFEKDVLQKMSDATLTTCPECKTESFTKQVTAAGFQLKGNGWYATDFKGGNKPAEAPKSSPETSSAAATTPAAPVATPSSAKTEPTST